MISKKSYRILLLIALIFLITLNACNVNPIDHDFQKLVGVKISNVVDITPLNGTSIKPNETIQLYVKNRTSNCLIFPYNFGIRVFIFQDGKWIEVPTPDSAIYVDQSDIILEPEGGLSNDGVTFVKPDFSKIGPIISSLHVRVVFIGTTCKNGQPTDNKIADYVNLSINH